MDSLRDQLARVDLFSGLPPDVLDALIERGTTMTHQPGRVVVQQGAADSGFHLILDGQLAVLVHDVPRRTMSAGESFGEISLIDRQPRSATVVVAGDSPAKTFRVSPLAFWEVVDGHPDAVRLLLTSVTARLRAVEAIAFADADG